MSEADNPKSHPRLESTKLRFEEWRRTRLKRKPMPEDLWTEAIELVGEYTPSAVMKALRLNSGELKKRLERRCDDQQSPSAGGMANFVELKLSASHSDSLTEATEYTLELEAATGRKLRLRTVGRIDVAQLVQAFWEGSG